MCTLSQTGISTELNRSSSSGMTTTLSSNAVVRDYLLEHLIVFKELMELKQKGWESSEGDQHFKEQRTRADHADNHSQRVLYNMMCQIGDKLHYSTSALSLPSAQGMHPSVLDLCMAPGGFTSSALKRNYMATVCGISLPLSQGGHKILLPGWETNPRVHVRFLDITMLAAEMDVTDIPANHPDVFNILPERPFYSERFDLIFCDGQVLRMHPRAEYREKREASRLLTSQLVLAIQRVKVDGKIVALLHRLDAWDTVALLHTLSKFSSLKLFKPRKKHAIRSSFYIIAEKLQPQCMEASKAVASWKREWYVATFGSDVEYEEYRGRSAGKVNDVMSEFGTELIRLGQPIWKIQGVALSGAPFIRRETPVWL